MPQTKSRHKQFAKRQKSCTRDNVQLWIVDCLTFEFWLEQKVSLSHLKMLIFMQFALSLMWQAAIAFHHIFVFAIEAHNIFTITAKKYDIKSFHCRCASQIITLTLQTLFDNLMQQIIRSNDVYLNIYENNIFYVHRLNAK